MRIQTVNDYSVYLAVRIVLCVVQALRMETCQQLARGLAWLFCHALRIRRQVVDDNLRHAYPHLDDGARRRLAQRMWEHLFLMVAEVAHARRKIHRSNWRRYVTIPNISQMGQLLLDERPAVMVTGHFGNFELAGYVIGLLGFPTVTVARTLDNPYLDRFVNRFRGSTGQYMIPKSGSSRAIERFLRRGATLTLLGDQSAGSRKGCWIDFFGRPASAHKAIALFSLSHESPLLVTYSQRMRRPLEYEVGTAALADPRDPGYKWSSVPALTQWYSAQLEEIINRAPEQYWWVHRRWKGAPPVRKRKAIEAQKQAA